MKWIKFNGLTFRAPVGFYDEEGTLQNTIVVDVHLHDKENITYRLDTILALVSKQLKQRSMLIERVASSILVAILEHYGPIKHARVRIRKVPPPMIGRIAASFVEIESEEENGVLPLGRIGVEGMQFHVNWGSDPQEKLLGYPIEITLKVQAPLLAAATNDDLGKTVNYQGIYDICRFVADHHAENPEAAVIEIENRILALFSNLSNILIIIHRPASNAMQPNSIITYEQDRNYVATCPRCEKDTICYQNSDCWCQKEKLFSRTLDVLAKQYGDECLCQSCLKKYAR